MFEVPTNVQVVFDEAFVQPSDGKHRKTIVPIVTSFIRNSCFGFFRNDRKRFWYCHC